MKLKEFREIVRKVYDAPFLSTFDKLFCELVMKAPDEKAEKLMRALPETIEKLKEFSEVLEDEN